MSAFLVQNKTINKVVSKVFHGRNVEHIQYRLKEIGINNDEDLGEAMYKLNCDSLNQRYKDGADGFKNGDYKYSFIGGQTMITTLKALECWNYQCSEGDIPEKNRLFKIMEGLELSLCKSIIREQLPEYENSAWD